MFTDYPGDINYIVKPKRGFRVDIEKEKIRGFIGPGFRKSYMDFKRGQVCEPD